MMSIVSIILVALCFSHTAFGQGNDIQVSCDSFDDCLGCAANKCVWCSYSLSKGYCSDNWNLWNNKAQPWSLCSTWIQAQNNCPYNNYNADDNTIGYTGNDVFAAVAIPLAVLFSAAIAYALTRWHSFKLIQGFKYNPVIGAVAVERDSRAPSVEMGPMVGGGVGTVSPNARIPNAMSDLIYKQRLLAITTFGLLCVSFGLLLASAIADHYFVLRARGSTVNYYGLVRIHTTTTGDDINYSDACDDLNSENQAHDKKRCQTLQAAFYLSIVYLSLNLLLMAVTILTILSRFFNRQSLVTIGVFNALVVISTLNMCQLLTLSLSALLPLTSLISEHAYTNFGNFLMAYNGPSWYFGVSWGTLLASFIVCCLASILGYRYLVNNAYPVNNAHMDPTILDPSEKYGMGHGIPHAPTHLPPVKPGQAATMTTVGRVGGPTVTQTSVAPIPHAVSSSTAPSSFTAAETTSGYTSAFA